MIFQGNSSRSTSGISENISLHPLTENMGMIRRNRGEQKVKKVNENDKVRSEKVGKVIILNFTEISKIYFSQSRSCINIQTSLDETKTRRTFSI